MRITIALSVLVVLLASVAAYIVLKDAAPEERYFETRDSFIREFKKATEPVDERSALAELEKQIRTIVGPAGYEGFPGRGKINLETLQNQLGVGQIDGLRFSSDREFLVVTTESLLKNYLTERPELPKGLRELAETEFFYTSALLPGADTSFSLEVPIKSAKGQLFARAFLGVTAQSFRPVVPEEIFVFVSRGNQILLVYTKATANITNIPKCWAEWESLDKKRSEASEHYQASRLSSEETLRDAHRREKLALEAYHQCFDREASSQPFFSSLTQQAQSIVDRL